MRNKIIILMLILVIGCKQQSLEPKLDPKKVYSGTEGLVINFLDITPTQVYENDKFSIGFRIHNKGAFRINQGLIDINSEDGYIKIKKNKLEDKLSWNDGKIQFNLEGKSLYNLEGGIKDIILEASTEKLPAQRSTQSVNILLTACYEYKTKLVDTICINPDIYGNQEKACEMRDKSYSGQGAPVLITRIETKISSTSKVKFIIHIQNIGNGLVISKHDVENACSGKKINYNVIHIEKAMLGNKNIRCDKKEIKLKADSTTIVCESDIDKNGAYSTTINLELSYGYITSKSKIITIKKSK